MKNNFLHYKHDLFKSLETCKNVLIEEGLVKKMGKCDKCGSVSELIIYSEKNKQRLVYRCKSTGCQAKKALFKGNRLPFEEFLFLIYLILLKEDYNQIKHLYHVSNTKIASVKNRLRSYFEMKNKQGLLIGGIGVKVEVDETVLCRRGIIRNPSSADDEIKDTVWILGIIDTSCKENFYVKRVENRSAATITNVLDGKRGVGSILASDGWASYPAVSDNLSLTHIVVNHSEGFINEDGTHTNNIEALWSCMKSEMGKQHGVKREDIDMWLEEFMFRRKYIDTSSPESAKQVLYEIIKYLVK